MAKINKGTIIGAGLAGLFAIASAVWGDYNQQRQIEAAVDRRCGTAEGDHSEEETEEES